MRYKGSQNRAIKTPHIPKTEKQNAVAKKRHTLLICTIASTPLLVF
ncbi:hypothetical protein GARC_0089 [Paraglaciecola arctica BSs20135]|uniref:Uncharacterized protein n=1 Tax=Paraglaciecola arctica BSs20135 TaxID=493475 RepID=K6XZH4_9ALTE|nr:hypothetical protein GARC_0089 [Paraglaciecola arctica BSs20135]